MTVRKITTAGFLSEFLARHEKMADRPFCWVLGSGASFQSGIPTGGTLAVQWLKELHEMEDFDNRPLEKWATAVNLGIKGFDFARASAFYPFIYQRRFRDFREQGYAFLEDVMQAAEPSYGYCVLSQIMSSSQHKVAVTTNFDNLIADAISTYTKDYPLVCGHESLTGFIRPHLSRPVIAKIHRDLLLNPKSEPEEIERLPPEWEAALQEIFDNNTPVVIGYGGNDGSLMGFLKKIAPIKGGIFWCFRAGNEPDAKINEMVARHHGRFVPVLGFDELMLQLWEKLKLPSPIPDLQATHDRRKAEFERQFEELTKKLRQPGETPAGEAELELVRPAAEAAVERLTREKNWWAWHLKAKGEPDAATSEEIYREGLKDFPQSGGLAGSFASFLADVGKKYDEAEHFYRRALTLDPMNALVMGNFARFLTDVRKEHDEAERLYRKALELDPRNAPTTRNFASFLTGVRKEYDEAERLYLAALSLEPRNAVNIAALANFFVDIRQDLAAANRIYLQSQQFHNRTRAQYERFLKDHPQVADVKVIGSSQPNEH